MNYLNEEYKNLSDLDKKNILPGIINFLEKKLEVTVLFQFLLK